MWGNDIQRREDFSADAFYIHYTTRSCSASGIRLSYYDYYYYLLHYYYDYDCD